MRNLRWPGSIFTKLLLVFVITGGVASLLTYFSANYFLSLHDQVWQTRNRNRQEYANLIADRIGMPPNMERVKEIVDRTGMKMRIEEGDKILVSTPGMPAYDELIQKGRRCVWENDIKVINQYSRVFVVLERPGVRYLFQYQNTNSWDERPELWTMLLAGFLMALALAYIAIRKLFRPLEWLSEGVRHVHGGKLDVQIQTGNNDELGRLTNSFNEMTQKISQMLNAKEQLLLDVSHELRSPLTRIKVALELDDEQAKKQIQQSVKELETMVSELLESARLDTERGGLNPRPTDLGSLITQVREKFGGRTPGIVQQVANEKITLHIDPFRIEIVLRNILENALNHSHFQTKPVEVQVERADGAGQVKIHVKDYGHGIPGNERELVFEPFYRIDKSRVRETGGYGLGLALCKKIVEAHGGKIEISESSSSGTTFTISLPS